MSNNAVNMKPFSGKVFSGAAEGVIREVKSSLFLRIAGTNKEEPIPSPFVLIKTCEGKPPTSINDKGAAYFMNKPQVDKRIGIEYTGRVYDKSDSEFVQCAKERMLSWIEAGFAAPEKEIGKRLVTIVKFEAQTADVVSERISQILNAYKNPHLAKMSGLKFELILASGFLGSNKMVEDKICGIGFPACSGQEEEYLVDECVWAIRGIVGYGQNKVKESELAASSMDAGDRKDSISNGAVAATTAAAGNHIVKSKPNALYFFMIPLLLFLLAIFFKRS